MSLESSFRSTGEHCCASVLCIPSGNIHLWHPPTGRQTCCSSMPALVLQSFRHVGRETWGRYHLLLREQRGMAARYVRILFTVPDLSAQVSFSVCI